MTAPDLLPGHAVVGQVVEFSVKFTAVPAALVAEVRSPGNPLETFTGSPTGEGWEQKGMSPNFTFRYTTHRSGRHFIHIAADDEERAQGFFDVDPNVARTASLPKNIR